MPSRAARGAIKVYEELLVQHPDRLDYVWMLNIAYMTLGEHPAKVPEAYRIPASAFDRGHDIPRFPEIAPALGVDAFGLEWRPHLHRRNAAGRPRPRARHHGH